jgi:thiamine biosynthesis lipoprotein
VALAAATLLGGFTPSPAAPSPAAASGMTRARWLMGTLWTASAPATADRAGSPGDTARTGEALEAALDTVAALERRLTNWSEASELSRLNAAGGGTVSEPLFAVLDSALALAALTGGAFDPTVESLALAWDLRGSGRIPSAAALAAARSAVGWRRVTLDRARSHVELHGARLDLGGIGKGFALDRAAGVIAARGIEDATLDAGGQRLRMSPAPSSVWVAHPERRDDPAVCLVLGAGSLSTSAQAERSLAVGGTRVGHILDPRTGRPVRARASVSVFAGSGTRADALSTALLVMGHDAARGFAARHSELGVLWLEPGGSRVVAEAWNLPIAAAALFVTSATRALTCIPESPR